MTSRANGIGGALLEHAIAQHPGAMYLEASPFRNQALSAEQLRSFYGKRGFRPGKRGVMTRKAQ